MAAERDSDIWSAVAWYRFLFPSDSPRSVPDRQWVRLLRAVGDPDIDDDVETVTSEQLTTYVTDQVSQRDLWRGLFDIGGGGRRGGHGRR
jgi:hypothetical protein